MSQNMHCLSLKKTGSMLFKQKCNVVFQDIILALPISTYFPFLNKGTAEQASPNIILFA